MDTEREKETSENMKEQNKMHMTWASFNSYPSVSVLFAV